MNRARITLAGLALIAAVCGTRAQGFMPVSRDVEAPYSSLLHHYRTPFHTSVRPYLRNEVDALPGADTLRPRALFGWMDRLAGAPDVTPGTTVKRAIRGGVLLDAEIGAPFGEDPGVTHLAGGGFWGEWIARHDLSIQLDGQIWNERFPEYLDTLVKASQVTLGEGHANGSATARYKAGNAGPYTHYDWNGSVNWRAMKYVHLTLGRGKHFFGEGHRSLFLSDVATGYPYFKITTTAWHIRYVNLFTMLNDVRGANGDPADFRRKYASFHYLSWNASRRINFGIFESIIWQDDDPDYPRGFDINYLNPVVVYRPQEFAQGSADNALLGLAINARVGASTQLYSQFMLDEFLLREVRNGQGWFANKQGFQFGLAAYDAFKTRGLFLRLEFDYVRPFTYTHSDTRQNYSHFGQPLAHPYGSNFWELIGQARYTRDRWTYSAHVSYALLGSDTSTASFGNNIFRPESDRFLTETGEHDHYYYYVGDGAEVLLFYSELKAAYLVDPHTGLSLEASYTFRSRMPTGHPDHVTNFFRLGIATHFREHYRDQEVRYVLE